jgi:hypothetical protein
MYVFLLYLLFLSFSRHPFSSLQYSESIAIAEREIELLNEEKLQILAQINEEMEALKANLNNSKDFQSEQINNLKNKKKKTIEVRLRLYSLLCNCCVLFVRSFVVCSFVCLLFVCLFDCSFVTFCLFVSFVCFPSHF